MAKYVLKIITDDDKLSERATESDVFLQGKHIIKVMNDLKDTIRANKDLSALSAPQLGYDERVFCLRFDNNDIRCFINPLVTKSSDDWTYQTEKALSSDDMFLVRRHNKISAIYQTPTHLTGYVPGEQYIPGKPEESDFDGEAAIRFQQMVDVLDGVLVNRKLLGEYYNLKLNKDFLKQWSEATDDEKTQFVELDTKRQEELNKLAQSLVDSDEDSTQTVRASKFLEKIATGELTIDVQKQEQENPEESK